MHVYSSVGNRPAFFTSVHLVRIILVRSYAALSGVLSELHASNLAQDIVCSDGRVLSLESITGISRNISSLPLSSTPILCHSYSVIRLREV